MLLLFESKVRTGSELGPLCADPSAALQHPSGLRAPEQLDLFRRAADCVAEILNGAKPSDIPVYLASKFELVINLKTAKMLGLTISPSLLARADEVIE